MPASRDSPGTLVLVLVMIGAAALIVGALLIRVMIGEAEAHDFFTGKRNAKGEICCNMKDCGKIGVCTLPDGAEGVSIRGDCLAVPAHALMPEPSPNGDVFGCMMPYDTQPRCVWYGGSS